MRRVLRTHLLTIAAKAGIHFSAHFRQMDAGIQSVMER